MKKLQEKIGFKEIVCGCRCFLIILVFVSSIGAAFLGAATSLDELITNTKPVAYAKQQVFKHPKVVECLG